MAARMSGRSWVLGIKKVFIVSVIMGSLYIILAVITKFITDWSLARSFTFAFVPVYAISMLRSLWVFVRGRQNAGSLIHDFGKHPQQRLYMFNASMSLLIAVMYMFPPSGLEDSLLTQYAPYFFFVNGIAAIFMSFGRLQIREKGIWSYWVLLPWTKISDYEWAENANLFINLKGWVGFRQRGVAVPPEDKAIFEQYLSEHIHSNDD